MERVSLRRLVLVSVLVLSSCAFAQETQETHQQKVQQTEPLASSRYRIVQSDLTAKVTFKLDRYAGSVWQLVKDKDGNNDWQSMEVSPLAAIKAPDHARFQIFTSALSVRFTFLIDNDSGRTWQLVQSTSTAPDGTQSNVDSWQLVPNVAP